MQNINPKRPNVRLQDDFFESINGQWLEKHPIPDEENIWGCFSVLRKKTSQNLYKILKEIILLPEEGLDHNQKLLKSFFISGLNFEKHQNNHLNTLSNELKLIQDINSHDQLAGYLGYFHKKFSGFWGTYVSIDDKDCNNQVLFFEQYGLTLPSRDYYLDKSITMKNIRKKYDEYLGAMQLELPNHMPKNYKSVIEIEKKLASASWEESKLRDTNKNYNKYTVDELEARFPDFSWREYFDGLGWKNPNDHIIIGQPSFIDECLKIMLDDKLCDIKAYLCWTIVNSVGPYIGKNTADLNFNFFGKIINGKKKSLPIWRQIISSTNQHSIGEILGQQYSLQFFPESSKNEVLDIVSNVRKAYHSRIENVKWMSPKTKKLAHIKLDNINVLIGYPSKIKNFSCLRYFKDDFIKNIFLSLDFSHNLNISKIGKKPDVENWQMKASTVNAYFDPNRLDICFPAGILQKPFYDSRSSIASNYGGIGSVVGHELTHGFDDQGSDFDMNGNLRDWQTKSDHIAFKELAKKLEKQADAFEALPGLFLKGKLVIGEAIADIGGLELAIDALKLSQSGKISKKQISELIISFCKTECSAERPESSLENIKTDPHPPSKFRVNCTLQNIDDCYLAFDVKPTDKMYLAPEDRIHIW